MRPAIKASCAHPTALPIGAADFGASVDCTKPRGQAMAGPSGRGSAAATEGTHLACGTRGRALRRPATRRVFDGL